MEEWIFFGNTSQQWTHAGAVASGLGLFSWILKTILAKKTQEWSRKTETKLDDWVHLLIEHTGTTFLFILSIFIASHFLTLDLHIVKGFSYLFKFTMFFQLGIWGNHSIHFFIKEYTNSASSDPGKATTLSALSVVIKILFWITLSLLLLENLGVNVSSMIAGLGIGGIAIALAVQNVLGDILASLSIVLDKPFVIGDTIQVDNDLGTVVHIGLKTTRLVSLGGEQLIFSNSELLKSRIRNYRRMRERRIEFILGVTYETSQEKLERIQDIVKETINNIADVRFERCFLINFASSSLDFKISYYVKSPIFDNFASIHHTLSLALLARLKKENIDIAYPTQKIFLENQP